MSISDRIVATIKTGVPALIGIALANLIAAVPAVADVITFIDTHLSEITDGVPVATILKWAATAGVIAGYYWVAAWLGDKYPPIRKWLLGSSLVPIYDPHVAVDTNGDVSLMTRAEYRASITNAE